MAEWLNACNEYTMNSRFGNEAAVFVLGLPPLYLLTNSHRVGRVIPRLPFTTPIKAYVSRQMSIATTFRSW